MADQHRATDSEWYCLEARTCGDKSDAPAYSCLLELRDRIEALEAKDEDDKEAWAARLRRPGRSQVERIASLAERITSLQERIEALEVAHRGRPNHEELPDGSLMTRVAAAIHPNVCADPNLYLHEARAAIRELAKWLSQESSGHLGGGEYWAIRLEHEAER